MKKIKVFISSVQSEFAEERQMLFDYLIRDALLGLFFEPFIFEKTSASSRKPDDLYLDEVSACDIYIGIFGKEYGNEDDKGISPTEHEYDLAANLNKTRLIFISTNLSTERHPKELLLIKKAEREVIRKKFTVSAELKTFVYASLINYLEEKEYLRTGPFDAATSAESSLDDIDKEKIVQFVREAKAKRGFSLSEQTPVKEILTHLDLLKNGKPTNAAQLLFGKKPQHYFISSEIKCARFHGYDVVKPIPSYQIYKGNVFQLVDQAVDFVLSKIDLSVGSRESSVVVPVEYEIPQAVVTEAIVNAVAHRDYTSNGSVQVMLFKDRLEVWNPGTLPPELTLSKLRVAHGSFPANPLIAEAMYLAGYIERIGSGTRDMIRLCKEAGLSEPEYRLEDGFRIIIWRTGQPTGQPNGQPNGQVTGQVTGQPIGEVSDEVAEQIRRVIVAMNGEMKRSEIQKILGLKHREFFIDNYLSPSIEAGVIEMTYPDTPNHPKQKYRLTAKGLELKVKYSTQDT